MFVCFSFACFLNNDQRLPEERETKESIDWNLKWKNYHLTLKRWSKYNTEKKTEGSRWKEEKVREFGN